MNVELLVMIILFGLLAVMFCIWFLVLRHDKSKTACVIFDIILIALCVSSVGVSVYARNRIISEEEKNAIPEMEVQTITTPTVEEVAPEEQSVSGNETDFSVSTNAVTGTEGDGTKHDTQNEKGELPMIGTE